MDIYELIVFNDLKIKSLTVPNTTTTSSTRYNEEITTGK